MIDMHCHIDLYPNPSHIVRECKERGLYVLSVTTTPKAWEGTNSLTTGYTKIRTALGLHPQLAHERYKELELFDALLPKTRYVGEIGLDGSKDYRSYHEQQLKVFRHILNRVQQSGGRIMTIHSRSSVTETLDELAKYQNIGIPILHWFTGSKTELRRAIMLGCWFSIGPAMLNTERGLSLANEIPKTHLLPETDGPFAQIKKRSLLPWDAQLVIQQLSTLWNQDIKSVEGQLFQNFRTLVSSDMKQD